MTLLPLLAALAQNSISITLKEDGADTGLITFNAPGYGQIESDLGTRTVKDVWVTASNAVTIVLDPA